MSSMIRRLIATFATAALVTLSASGPTFGFCAGDCNHDGTVAINELIIGVNIAAGRMAVDQCSYLDLNDDGEISIDELIGAVTISLDGCYALRPFSTIQQVFTQSCALSSCHSALGRKGNMVIDNEDLSFQSLVNAEPDNAEARAMGWMRVKPGDVENSYLIHKLRGDGPGDAMPQGGRPLPADIIHTIEDWIQRGAPTTEQDCAPTANGGGSHVIRQGNSNLLCNDVPITTGDFVWKPEEPLDPPPAGEGIQFHVPPRPVMPGMEWETCYAFRPDLASLPSSIIQRQVYRMNEGSHHMLLYMYWGPHPDQFADGYWPCFAANCVNPEDCPEDNGQYLLPIGGTQVAGTHYEVDYPEGVGIPLLGSSPVIIVNNHFTNPFVPPQDIYGETWVNLEFYQPKEFKALLDGIFAINARDLLVEPYETRTISALWHPHGLLSPGGVDAAVFQLFGHMHKRGIEFTIDLVDGDTETRIYRTTSWDNAPVVNYPPPYLIVKKDQALKWSCTHQNGRLGDPNFPPKKCHEGCVACGWKDADRKCHFRDGRVFDEGQPMPLVFGALADDDMCNMFGYFVSVADLDKLK